MVYSQVKSDESWIKAYVSRAALMPQVLCHFLLVEVGLSRDRSQTNNIPIEKRKHRASLFLVVVWSRIITGIGSINTTRSVTRFDVVM